ncbi:MAG: glycosyl hydrolase family 28 protein [Bacteroidetes bacterium]|nr:glycosyl hydrolase family 28 protein [Bacteroidota bacterium]
MRSTYLMLVTMLWVTWAFGQDNQGKGYSLTGNGKSIEVKVFTHYQYVSFDLLKPTELILTSNKPIGSCEISPRSRGINCQVKGNRVTFTLDKPGYVMVRINDTEKFFVFAEVPEPIPADAVNILIYGVDNSGQKTQTALIQKAMDETALSGKTLLFPKGVYTAGQLRPQSNTHIHLVRGATLQSDLSNVTQYSSDDKVTTRKFIYIKDADQVKITGYGAINGNGAQLREKFGDDARMRLIMAVNSKNLTIEGVMLQDPGSWNTQILLCQDVLIRNVKLMNNTELSNTDGFDPDASKRVLIEDCFAYCGDDNIAIKTTNYGNYLGDVDDITVRGCVFLTKKSSLKVGTETRAASMRNILFENNDVLESDRGMALYDSDGAVFENIRFINNRFERNYPDAKRAGFYFQVNKRNKESKPGQIKNILVRDCVFYTAFPKPSVIEGLDSTHCIENVTIDNLQIEAKKANTLQDARILTNEFVRNLIFK